MKKYNLAFLGFGNVGRALVQFFDSKRAELRHTYGIEFTFTGVAFAAGLARQPGGYTAAETALYPTASQPGGVRAVRRPPRLGGLGDWLRASQANVMFDTPGWTRAPASPRSTTFARR